ncbi:MAG: hypothetical protein JW900_13720 [Anaerolineae bacterium]|nr:hypothetical protein [Anaerolineae bacterium]
MSLTRGALSLTTLLAAALLALAYSLNGYLGWTVVAVLLGALWLLGQRRRWRWAGPVALASFVGLAALGTWYEFGAWWMAAAVTAALSAWDLEHLARRQHELARVEREKQFERQHLGRLLAVDGLALLLAGIALLIRFQFTFGGALLLGGALILGVARAVRFLRRESGRELPPSGSTTPLVHPRWRDSFARIVGNPWGDARVRYRAPEDEPAPR